MIKRKVVPSKKAPATTKKVAAVPTPKKTTRVQQPVVAPVIAPTNAVTVETGGKFRRLKDNGVNKVERFERELSTEDRDEVIRWWNLNQRLVDKDDPACVELTRSINGRRRANLLSPMQVAGYFSYLCRLGLWEETRRNTRIDVSIRKGRFSVVPVFSRPLITAIRVNWEREREDERLRREAHAAIRAARANGQRIRPTGAPRVAPTQTVVQPAPVRQARVSTPAPVTSDEFDIADITWN